MREPSESETEESPRGVKGMDLLNNEDGSKENLRFDVAEGSPNVLKKVPKENLLVNNNELNMKSKSGVGNEEVSDFTSTTKGLPADGNDRAQCESVPDSKVHSKGAVPQPKDMETRLEKIPKDILWKLGIVIEDNDEGWRVSPEPNRWKEEEEVSVEDEDNDGRLVIDERVAGAEDSAPASSGDPSDQQQQHHLIISSVVSLRKNVYCNKCHEILSDAESLARHNRNHCSFHGCLDVIENDGEREKHLQVHFSHPSKPFRCEHCKKRFRHYWYSKRHRDTCKSSKRSKCPHCKFTFSKLSLYNKHIAKHMSKVTCTDCNKTYIQVKKYSKHLYVHHGKQIVFQCTECPRRFQMEDNIVRHIKAHNLSITDSGLAPYITVEAVN